MPVCSSPLNVGESQTGSKTLIQCMPVCSSPLNVYESQTGLSSVHACLFISTRCLWESNRTVLSACLSVHLHQMSVKVKQNGHQCMPICLSPLDVCESQTGPSSVHACLFISTRCLWKSNRTLKHSMPVCSSPPDVRESQTGRSSVQACLFISTKCLWKSDSI